MAFILQFEAPRLRLSTRHRWDENRDFKPILGRSSDTFMLKNIRFLSKNLHFLLKNLRFLLKNLHFNIENTSQVEEKRLAVQGGA